MTRLLRQTFARCARRGRPALMTFMTAGDPSTDWSVRLAQDLPAAGADIVEIGFPAADPFMDGPLIRGAHARARAAGADAATAFTVARGVRAASPRTPVVLMGYRETVRALGIAPLAAAAAQAGAQALLFVDLEPHEAAAMRAACAANELAWIPVAPADMPEAAVASALSGADGFLYCVAGRGPTGGSAPNPLDLARRLARLRLVTDLPLLAGYGIRTPEVARAIGRLADGIAVGTALAERVDAAPGWERDTLAFVAGLAASLDGCAEAGAGGRRKKGD